MGLITPTAGHYRSDSTPESRSGPYSNGAYLIDGDDSTYRGTDASRNDNYFIDLGSSKAVNKLVFSLYPHNGYEPTRWRTSEGNVIKVYGSTDDTNFTLLQTFTQPAFTEHSSTYVRLPLEFSSAQTYQQFCVFLDSSNGLVFQSDSHGWIAAKASRLEAYDNKVTASSSPLDISVLVDSSDITIEGAYSENLGISVSMEAPEVQKEGAYPDSISVSTLLNQGSIPWPIYAEDLNISVGILGSTYSGEVVVEVEYNSPVGFGNVKFENFKTIGYSGASCALNFSAFKISGFGSEAIIGNGKLNFSDFNVLGYCTNSGFIFFEDFKISGSGLISILGFGDIKFPTFKILSNSSFVLGDGIIQFPVFKLQGSSYSGILGNGKCKISGFKVSGNSVVSIIADGIILFNFKIHASGYLQSFGDGIIIFPDFGIVSTGTFPDNVDSVILEHKRNERFIT